MPTTVTIAQHMIAVAIAVLCWCAVTAVILRWVSTATHDMQEASGRDEDEGKYVSHNGADK